jgi:hypothetical protein
MTDNKFRLKGPATEVEGHKLKLRRSEDAEGQQADAELPVDEERETPETEVEGHAKKFWK